MNSLPTELLQEIGLAEVEIVPALSQVSKQFRLVFRGYEEPWKRLCEPFTKKAGEIVAANSYLEKYWRQIEINYLTRQYLEDMNNGVNRVSELAALGPRTLWELEKSTHEFGEAYIASEMHSYISKRQNLQIVSELVSQNHTDLLDYLFARLGLERPVVDPSSVVRGTADDARRILDKARSSNYSAQQQRPRKMANRQKLELNIAFEFCLNWIQEFGNAELVLGKKSLTWQTFVKLHDDLYILLGSRTAFYTALEFEVATSGMRYIEPLEMLLRVVDTPEDMLYKAVFSSPSLLARNPDWSLKNPHQTADTDELVLEAWRLDSLLLPDWQDPLDVDPHVGNVVTDGTEHYIVLKTSAQQFKVLTKSGASFSLYQAHCQLSNLKQIFPAAGKFFSHYVNNRFVPRQIYTEHLYTLVR